MKIFNAKNDTFYSIKSRILGNCYNVLHNNHIYRYEFQITDFIATIITDNIDFIQEVVKEFRKSKKHIYIFKTLDNSYYEEFDKTYTYKLPINILQVSSFFLDETKIKLYEEHLDIESITLPVKIINDEYVLLDGHHELYIAYKNYLKMINVYLETNTDYNFIDDFVYLAKEQNVKTIKDLQILSHEEYELITEQLNQSIKISKKII